MVFIPKEQEIQAVMDATDCDRWIAKNALADVDGKGQSAIELIQERLSHRGTVCRCGEHLAGKWIYCPYCGTRKKDSHAEDCS